MPIINLIDKSSYIQCGGDNYNDATWFFVAEYSLEPKPSEIIEENNEQVIINLDLDQIIPLPIQCKEDTEARIEYPLVIHRFGNLEYEPIPTHFLLSNFIKLDKLIDFDFLNDRIAKLSQRRFNFFLKIWEAVNLDELRSQHLIEEKTEEYGYLRVIKLSHSVIDDDSQPSGITIKDYPQIIGNLNEEIISNVQIAVETTPQLFQVQVQNYQKKFDLEEYKDLVNDALQTRTEETFNRISRYIEIHPEKFPKNKVFSSDTDETQQYQLFSDDKLLTALISNFNAHQNYQIDITLRDPTIELFYPTNVVALDQLMRDIHLELLQNGIPIENDDFRYQKILRELILYRYYCATRTGYIAAEVAQKTEVMGFHKHLLDRIGHHGFAIEVISEPDIGNSRLDLLIEGIPTELKLEDRKTFSTDDIIESFKHQAADYTARLNSLFGFLLVLDTVLDRSQATSPVNQDVKLVQVETSSGGTVSIVAIIVRIPRRASELTKYTIQGKNRFLDMVKEHTLMKSRPLSSR